MKAIRSLSRFEGGLWLFSAGAVTASFLLCGVMQPLVLCACLVGVTALLFVAKGAVLGQVLTVVFSLLYAVISYEFRYYGEMITYMGMTAPIAIMSVIAWLRHPYQNSGQVAVARLTKKAALWLWVLAAVVTAGFYFVLKAFGNANLLFSTISITTSFLASGLMLLRSPSYALAYAANDGVLIVLWVLAAMESPSSVPMVVCFGMFFLNDLYGFISWRKMKQAQAA